MMQDFVMVEASSTRVTITVPLSYLKRTMVQNNEAGEYGDKGLKLPAASVIGKAVASALQEEDEEGSTLVHKMLDRALEDAVENDLDNKFPERK